MCARYERDSGSVMPACFQRRREIASTFLQLRIQSDGPPEMLDRLTRLAERGQCDPEIIVRAGGVGHRAERRPKMVRGLGKLPALEQKTAELVLGAAVTRVEPYG